MRWEISFFVPVKILISSLKLDILISINLDSSGNEKTAVNCTWFSSLVLEDAAYYQPCHFSVRSSTLFDCLSEFTPA